MTVPVDKRLRVCTLAVVAGLLTLVTPCLATAVDEPTPGVAPSSSSLRSELLYGSDGPARRGPSPVGHRSVPMAAGLSALLPGAGQAYNRQWIKAGIGVLIEGVLILGYVKWRNEGLDGERAFKAQAHAEWSPAKYAEWVNDYSTFLEEEYGAAFTFEEISVPSTVDFTMPGAWSEADRIAVAALFREIRSAESELFHPETGASFSHRIPEFGDQQYYELIGKYFQFATGWEDYPEWQNEQGFTDAIDPERTNPDGTRTSVSPTFYQYARDHADSQDLLRRASHVTSLIVINHVVAAVDAAVFSKLHNNRLSASMSWRYDERGAPRPTAHLTLKL